MSEMVNSVLTIPVPNPNSDIFQVFTGFGICLNHNNFLPMAGMGIFAPDTVAGYPANYQSPNFDRQWFSSNTLLARYRLIDCLMSGRNKLATNGLIGTQLDCVDFVELMSSDPG